VLETSTLTLADKTAGRQALARYGGTMLDCPLSGTGAQAQRKDLVAYLSGDAAAKARARPVLAAMTPRQVYDVARLHMSFDSDTGGRRTGVISRELAGRRPRRLYGEPR
jgi:hypothetical protein